MTLQNHCILGLHLNGQLDASIISVSPGLWLATGDHGFNSQAIHFLVWP